MQALAIRAMRPLCALALATGTLVSVLVDDPAGSPGGVELTSMRGGLDRDYAKEIHKQLDYFAAWEPTNQFELGTYGEMEGKVFKRLGNIKRFGIQIKTETLSSGPITYTSSGDVAVDIDLGAKDAKGEYAVDVNVAFAKKKNILLKADGVTTERIKNLAAVGDALVDLYKEKGKDWKLSYVVITEIKHAKGGAVLISKESDSKVTLSGNAAVKKSGVKLADIDLRDFGVRVSKGQVYSQTWSRSCTPLFQLHEVKDPVLKKAYFTEYK